MNMRNGHPVVGPDDLAYVTDGDHYEFVDGVPVEKNMGAESDGIAGTLAGLLNTHCRANRLGRVFPETNYRCFPSRPTQRRRPDVSFVAAGRFPNDQPPKGDILLAPDLAVEVVSPGDGYEEMMLRIADFKDAKIRLIWVVSPETKTVLIRRADGSCAELDETGELSGEDVVPGFACKVSELFL